MLTFAADSMSGPEVRLQTGDVPPKPSPAHHRNERNKCLIFLKVRFNFNLCLE